MRFRYNQLKIINELSRSIHSSHHNRYEILIRFPDSGEIFSHYVDYKELDVATAIHHCIAGEITDRGYFVEGVDKYSKQAIVNA